MLFLDSLRKLRQRRHFPAPALRPTIYYVPVVTTLRACPECAGPLTPASGCLSCLYCGWGKCG